MTEGKSDAGASQRARWFAVLRTHRQFCGRPDIEAARLKRRSCTTSMQQGRERPAQVSNTESSRTLCMARCPIRSSLAFGST